ncbi:MAG: AraC family transcriptional regulator, partial [Paenibacillus sp.]|nr:AraC family transcriptional regulator [Paenibacillus sp.]
MNIIQHLTSRKYLQRIFFYFNLSMAGLLLVTAISFYLYSQQMILQTQKEANQKVLSHIKHNINYINDIVQNIGIIASLDQNMIYLMNAKNPDPVMTFQTHRKLDTLADSTTFVDSIFIFSGVTETFYSGGSGTWTRTHLKALQDRLLLQLESMETDSFAQLIPIKLDESRPDVDLFSFILTENHPTDGALPNTIIVNIRPQWIFDNIRSLDNMSESGDGMVLVDKNGAILQTDGMSSPPSEAVQRYLAGSMLSGMTPSEDFSIKRIDGEKYVISEASVGVSQWKVMNILPYDKVMGRAETLLDITLLFTFVFLAASFILSLVITNRLYRPIGKLFDMFKRNDMQTPDDEPRNKDEVSFMSDVYKQTLDKLQQVNKEERRNNQIVSDYYLRRWVSDSRSMTLDELDHCAEASPELFGDETEQMWQLAVISLDQAPQDGKSIESESQEKLYRFAACNIIEETVGREFPNRVVDMNNEYIVVIVGVRAGGIDIAALARLLTEARQTYKQYYRERSFSSAISLAVPGFKELTPLYERTVQQLMYRLSYGQGAVITPDLVEENNGRQDFIIPAELEKRLAESIKAKDADAVHAALIRMFDLIASIHYDYMTYAVIQVILLIKQVLREPGFSSSAHSVELHHLNQKVLKAETLAEMREIIEHFL